MAVHWKKGESAKVPQADAATCESFRLPSEPVTERGKRRKHTQSSTLRKAKKKLEARQKNCPKEDGYNMPGSLKCY